MSENKLDTQMTDLQGLEAGGKTFGPEAQDKLKPKSGKGQRSGKTKVRTKKVVVKMPSINRRLDDDHKLFPRGIEGMKGSLAQIQEESKDKLTDELVLNANKEQENKENFQSGDNSVGSGGNAPDNDKGNVQSSDNNNPNSEHLYGMFTRTNTELSLARSNSVSIIIPTKRKPSCSSIKRPKSTKGWSKREIDLFLPRKSFFSVHDNTLSNAGVGVRSDEDRKIPEWRNMLRMHTQDELYPPEEKEEEKPFQMLGMMDDESDEEDPFGLENVETAMSASNKESGTGTKGKRRHKDKKLLNSDKEEYRPLYDYLKYIHDNPEEYIHAYKYVGKNIDHRHPNGMVRLARAYRRGHHGVNRNSIYIHAITDLKQRMSETVVLRSTKAEKGNTKKESSDVAELPSLTSDESEIEKLKSKAEKWGKGLTTQQWLKARELALKDVGDEDTSMSKWWLVFRSCHYLRIPSHIPDLPH